MINASSGNHPFIKVYGTRRTEVESARQFDLSPGRLNIDDSLANHVKSPFIQIDALNHYVVLLRPDTSFRPTPLLGLRFQGCGD